MLLQQIVNAIWLGAVYSLFALGYTLVFSVLGILNLAYPSLYMWGAFAGLVAVNVFKLPIWLALPIAMLTSGLLGVPARSTGLQTVAQTERARAGGCHRQHWRFDCAGQHCPRHLQSRSLALSL